jgi:acyl-CoA thioester hydrolase
MTLELGSVTDRRSPFKYAARVRVGFSDTDAQGIVYYGRYLPYFDLARVEYLRHLDLTPTGREQQQFVMRASTIEYLAPAQFDDLLEVFIRVSRIGRTSSTWECAAYREPDGLLMVKAVQTLVYIDLAERAAREVPESIRARVRAFEGSDLLE